MLIIKMLLTNWDSVIVVIAAIAGVIMIYKRGETKLLKDILFRLVTKAEAEFGGGTGELKRAAVIEWLYERMPAILRFIVTRKDIDRLIDEVLSYAKDKWADNPNLRGIISGESLTMNIMKEYPKSNHAFDAALISPEDFEKIYEESKGFTPDTCINAPETNQSTLPLIAEGSQYIVGKQIKGN